MITPPLLPQPQPPKPKRPGALSPSQRQLLSQVSRSFDLTIRLLPAALQAPVAIGYLLARATDTVADTSALPLAERQVLLDRMSQAIAAPLTSAADSQELTRLSQAFAAQQTDPHERALMQALPQCLPLLQTLSEADQASVRGVLSHITRGQHLDMARFGPGLNALHTEAELQDYTWLVAGCVGEFWTELCGRHLPGCARLPQNEMLRIGREYGMGLQRLNIVRDAGADLAAGRCYWPAETLAQAALTPSMLAEAAQAAQAEQAHQVAHGAQATQIVHAAHAAHAAQAAQAAHHAKAAGQNSDPNTSSAASLQALGPLYDRWLDHTHAQLQGGMRYALALKPLRLRLASALPALIGARTVALLRQAGPAALGQRVKMPRHEMRAMLWRIALGLGSCAALEKEFRRLSGQAPGFECENLGP